MIKKKLFIVSGYFGSYLDEFSSWTAGVFIDRDAAESFRVEAAKLAREIDGTAVKTCYAMGSEAHQGTHLDPNALRDIGLGKNTEYLIEEMEICTDITFSVETRT